MSPPTYKPFAWTPLTVATAYISRPPTRYVIDELFEAGSLNVVYGSPGSLKSLLLLDACACVVAGVPWLESGPGSTTGRSFATEQGAALYLDFDNGMRRALDRLEAVARHRQLGDTAPLYVVAMPSPWLDLTKNNPRDNHAQMLAGYIQQYDARLVVLDNLGVISGDADENAADMAQVMAALRWVAETTGAALVVIHHQRKGAVGGKQRNGDSLRGHSSIEASLDLALRVERNPDDLDLLSIEATKARGVTVEPFGARFAYKHKRGTRDLETACFFGETPSNLSPDQQARNAISEVLSAQGALNQKNLVAEVQAHLGSAKIGRNRILRNLDTLVSRGLVAEQRGMVNNEKLYVAVFP